jgi:signal transduction histidine kinase
MLGGDTVADERARIACELHDVVAHALSAMTVQATVARRLVLTRPELAREAFVAIETAGREALDELRRVTIALERDGAETQVAHSMTVMVVQAADARRILDRDPSRALEAATRIERTGREVLDEMRHLLDGSGHPLAPQPTLSEIGELVGNARAAGLPTTLELRGTRRPLPAGLDLAAYRIIQEALTHALHHANHAPTTVTVAFSEHALVIEVRGHVAGGGHGLVGMRERVRLYGGGLEIGPADGGVRATLPLAGAELSLAS